MPRDPRNTWSVDQLVQIGWGRYTACNTGHVTDDVCKKTHFGYLPHFRSKLVPNCPRFDRSWRGAVCFFYFRRPDSRFFSKLICVQTGPGTGRLWCLDPGKCLPIRYSNLHKIKVKEVYSDFEFWVFLDLFSNFISCFFFDCAFSSKRFWNFKILFQGREQSVILVQDYRTWRSSGLFWDYLGIIWGFWIKNLL